MPTIILEEESVVGDHRDRSVSIDNKINLEKRAL